MKYFEIDAFFPIYKKEGPAQTCILLTNGTKQYSHYSIRQFIPHLLYDTGLDERSIRLWSSKVTGSKHLLPLIIDNLNVFIPIKFAIEGENNRISVVYGYVNLGSIAHYSNKEVILKSQVSLPTLSSIKYIEKKIVDAKLLTYAYLDIKKKYEFMWKEEAHMIEEMMK
nr:hypothetical protein [uncultured Cellulosilyticum sp.]